jgi:dUTP pyrophosphatase
MKEKKAITPGEAVKRSEEIFKRTEEILEYPSPYKVRGFEIVDHKHKKHKSETIIPTKGSRYSAGYDFYSNEFVNILPGKIHIFWTDVKAYIMNDEVLQMYVRSSLGIKKGLVLANGTGIIDADYFNNPKNDGNIGVCLRNESDEIQNIKKGEKIAQGIFIKFLLADNIIAENDRLGGIGSTGEK